MQTQINSVETFEGPPSVLEIRSCRSKKAAATAEASVVLPAPLPSSFIRGSRSIVFDGCGMDCDLGTPVVAPQGR
jgi:hypothetical protein